MKKTISLLLMMTILLFSILYTQAAPVSSVAPNCLMDIKECPDGTTVARNPSLGCAFNECTSLLSTKTFFEKITENIAKSTTLAKESLGVVASSQILKINDTGINTYIQLISVPANQKDYVIQSLKNIDEVSKNKLGEYTKIHVKYKKNNGIVFLKAYKLKQYRYFKFIQNDYYYIENNSLIKTTSWKYMNG